MKNIKEYLEDLGVSQELVSVFCTLADSVLKISTHIVTADRGKAGSMNVFGEEQLALDVLSDKIVMEECELNPLIGLLGSEELPDQVKISDGEYAICYDPLDGSSLVDVNLAVGSIFGIYKTDSFIGVKGDEMLGALAAVYGPRTTLTLSVGQGVAEFVMCDDKEFKLQNDSIKVGEGKMFAPGNLRACAFRADYMRLTEYWIKEQYTLRYSGGMVPDVNQILLKGKGIFSYPGYEEAPNGKLRLLFECGPLAYIMEQAGGKATDGSMRILEKTVERLDQRTPIFIGSRAEVDRCEEYLS